MSDIPATRNRVRLALDGREPDRVPGLDICRPERENHSAEHAPYALPGADVRLLTANLTPRYPEQILEQDGDDLVRTTAYGSVIRVSAAGLSLPESLDYPLKTRGDWKWIERRLEPAPDRVDWDAFKTAYEEGRTRSLYLAFSSPSGFEVCAAFAGVETLVDLVGEDPGLVREVADAQADLLTGMVDLLHTRGFEIDAVLLFDEMAGRRGTLFPLERYREVFAPVHRRLTDFFHSRGMKVILYSRGDLRLLIPALLDTGVDCLGPLEVAAGMDLPVLKLNYGADLAFLGGIDQRALSNPSPAALEREVANKLNAGMVKGRYIAGLDGPLPPDTPAEEYARFAELLAKYGKY